MHELLVFIAGMAKLYLAGIIMSSAVILIFSKKAATKWFRKCLTSPFRLIGKGARFIGGTALNIRRFLTRRIDNTISLETS